MFLKDYLKNSILIVRINRIQCQNYILSSPKFNVCNDDCFILLTKHLSCLLLSQNQKLRLELEKRKQKQHIMDVLNKFKSTLQSSVSSTVFSTVSTIKDVLPGNPVTREYEVGDHIASAGPGMF